MSSRVFLDTHVAFWLASGSKNLPAPAIREISNANERIISALSIAEIEVKAALGKWPIARGVAKAFLDQGFRIESFDAEAATAVTRFQSLLRHDPFDRMILAQASSKPGVRFFTADQALVGLGLDWVVDCS